MGFLCTGEQTENQKLQTLSAEFSLEEAKDHCNKQNSLIKSEWSHNEVVLAHSVTKRELEISWLQGMAVFWTGSIRVGPTEVMFENGTGNFNFNSSGQSIHF